MQSLTFDVTIETFRAVVTGVIFVYLIVQGKKSNLHEQPGWWLIRAGFGCIFFGACIDITDNFPVLNRFLIVGDTGYEAFLEKVLGYALGTLLLAAGFWKWLPAILELRETKERLAGSEQSFRNLIAASFDIITVVSPEGVVIFQSPSLERIFGYDPEELNGRNIFDFVHPDDLENVKRAFRDTIRQPGTYRHQDLRFLHKDGSWRIIEAVGSYAPQPAPGRVIINSRDITERKQAEEELIRNRTMLAEAQLVAHIGNWEWKPGTEELFWSEENYRIFGFSQEIKPSLKIFLDAVHPDDRAFVSKAIEEALQGKPYNVDMRILRPDGTERIINAQATVEFATDRTPLRMYGIMRDITEKN